MNYKVICFTELCGKLSVVREECFEMLAQAIFFENTEGLKDNRTSIQPLTESAKKELYD